MKPKPKRPPKPRRYKKPTEGAIHARLVPELAEELRVWRERLATRHKYLGQRLGMEGLIILLCVAAMERLSQSELDRILDDARPYAERYELDWNREQAAKEVAAEKVEMEKGKGKPHVSHSKDVPTGKAAGKRRGA